MDTILAILASLIEKIGLAWWHKHEIEAKESREPLTNEEEYSDIDKLPRV